MKQLNRTIISAGTSHISTIIVASLLILFPTDGQLITKDTLVDVVIKDTILIIVFPWIVTGVALFSTIMADPNKSDNNQNTNSMVIWRWRSYSWGAAIIMIIFSILSLETVGLYYLPTSILSIVTALLNK